MWLIRHAPQVLLLSLHYFPTLRLNTCLVNYLYIVYFGSNSFALLVINISTCMNLFFFVCFSPRHKSLDRAVECPSYILSGGVRKGCNFSGKPLPEFTDIYFCVNGSSREGPLKATFFSLQIQNQGVYMAAAMQALW